MQINGIINNSPVASFQGQKERKNNKTRKIVGIMKSLAIVGAAAGIACAAKSNNIPKMTKVKKYLQNKINKLNFKSNTERTIAQKEKLSHFVKLEPEVPVANELQDIAKTISSDLPDVSKLNLKPAEKLNIPIETTYYKKLSLEEFKKIGKFDKGNAYINSEGYNGIIQTPNKNNGKNILRYIDGVLNSSNYSIKRNRLKSNLSKETMERWENIKKLYTKINNAKIINTFTDTEIASESWVLDEITTIEPDKITIQTKSPIADKIKTILKNPDGSWAITLKKPALSSENRWQCITTDAKTGTLLNIEDIEFLNPKIPSYHKKSVLEKFKSLFQK